MSLSVIEILTVIEALEKVPWAGISAKARVDLERGGDITPEVIDVLQIIGLFWPPAASVAQAAQLFYDLENAGVIRVSPYPDKGTIPFI